MKKAGQVFVFLCICISAVAQSPADSLRARPKLVVGIMVDQMRWDFLYRYYDRYGSGGFKRLLADGFSCENTLINYLPSFTAVGHSTVFTGSVPSIDGIAGNDWIDQMTGKRYYCTDDSTVTSVGVKNSMEGKMSPRNLLVSTITDELRIATNFQSRVVGISLKDRAAILPAGHSANAAFWFDDSMARFITSSYYMKELPDWVSRFNGKNLVKQLISKGWSTLQPVSSYGESDADNMPYEGRFPGETSSSFPHDLKSIYAKSKVSFRSTPFGNTLTLEFAKAAIENYQLGSGASTDFLTINVASTDYVGHQFGPNSIEIEDTYLRLDKDLADFFRLLDEKVGRGQYLIFLTADHGVANSIGYMQAHNLPADYWYGAKVADTLNKVLSAKFHVPSLVRSLLNYQVNFDLRRIAENDLDFTAVKNASVDFLQRLPGISYAADMAFIGRYPIPKKLQEMMINGYNYKRSGQVQIILNSGWFDAYNKTGTTHGNWNPYDTHIPLLWYGWHIARGHSNREMYMTDIAPTIAALLHVQMPNGCIGQPIPEVIK
ncbi:MAG TPA: alkaline phosphatase PafA [Chitinophagaceae bacterium]